MPLIRWSALVCLVAAIAACAFKESDAGVSPSLERAQGKELLAEGQVRSNPKTVEADAFLREATTLLGEAKCFDQEKLARARRLLIQALVASQPNPEARIQLARYHLVSGSACTMSVDEEALRLAEDQLLAALKTDAQSPDALILLGSVLIQQRRYKDALEALDRAEMIGSKDPMLHVNFALAHTAMEDWRSAALRLRRIPVCSRSDASQAVCGGKIATMARIELHLGQGDRPATLQAYRESVEAFPDSAFMHGNYAGYLIREVGDVDAAIIEADKALAIRRYGQAERTLALALYAKWAQLKHSNPVSAQIHLEKAVALEPEAESLMAFAGCSVSNNDTLKKLVETWIAEGMSVDTHDAEGNSALIWASSCGSPGSVRWLLVHGASIDQRNDLGYTALLSAVSKGRDEIAAMLIKRGADPKLADRDGDTPLTKAVARRDLPTAKMLIEARAEVNAANAIGHTALMIAATSANEPMVKLLLEANADSKPRSRDGLNMDAAEMANAAGRPELAALIRSHQK